MQEYTISAQSEQNVVDPENVIFYISYQFSYVNRTLNSMYFYPISWVLYFQFG